MRGEAQGAVNPSEYERVRDEIVPTASYQVGSAVRTTCVVFDGASAPCGAATTPGAFLPRQFSNEDNVSAHEETTGPEIWRQTGGRIDVFFASIGTGGTITGVGRYLKERNPNVKVIGVEPAQRHHKLSGLKRVTGLPEEHFPSILDRKIVDDYISVTDDEAFAAGIRIARTDGLLVGPTTGAVLHAASVWSQENAGTAVVISADNAAKYLSAYAEYL